LTFLFCFSGKFPSSGVSAVAIAMSVIAEVYLL